MGDMEQGRVYNMLFLCTGNSARSIMAEALVNHWGHGNFRGFSAGSFPTGRVNPLALELLAHMHIPIAGARSKSWEEFAGAGGIEFDFVITVCDQAAGESCPIWAGQPMTAHWGVEDPAVVEGSDTRKMLAFRAAFHALEHRIRIFMSLPFGTLDRMRLQQKLGDIGREKPAADDASCSA